VGEGESTTYPCVASHIVLCFPHRLLARVLLFHTPSRCICLFPQRLEVGPHLLDVAFALSGLPFYRLPALFELSELAPAHVELYATLLFFGSRLSQPSASIRNLAHVSSSATDRLRGGASETCEECLKEVLSRGERRLRCGVLFFDGIIFRSDGIHLRPLCC
jgi:hypothetical protein